MKIIIIMLAGIFYWSACQQPSTTQSSASDTEKSKNAIDTSRHTDTSSYDNMSNRPYNDTSTQ